jgi:hypothetical protein
MVQRLFRSQALFGIPAETACHKVEEGLVVAFEGVLERLGVDAAAPALGGYDHPRLTLGIEEQFATRGFFDEVFLGRAEDFHDACKLLLLVFSGEDGVAREQLRQDAAE